MRNGKLIVSINKGKRVRKALVNSEDEKRNIINNLDTKEEETKVERPQKRNAYAKDYIEDEKVNDNEKFEFDDKLLEEISNSEETTKNDTKDENKTVTRTINDITTKRRKRIKSRKNISNNDVKSMEDVDKTDEKDFVEDSRNKIIHKSTLDVVIDNEKDEEKEVKIVKNKKKEKRIRGLDKRFEDGIKILNKYKEKILNDRQKRIGKTYNEAKQEQKKKIKKESKINIALRKVIFTVVTLVILILVYLIYVYGPIFGISLDRLDSKKEKKIDIVTTESDVYTNYNEELLVYSNQKIVTYDKNAKRTWEYSLDQMFNPSIYVYQRYMAVANNTNGNIYLFENKKEILDMKIDGSISHIYLDEDGNMAVEYSSSGYKKIIGIYNKKGNNLYNAYLDNDSIVELKMIDNANKLILFQTNVTSFKVGIKVSLIDGTKSENNLSQIAKLDNSYTFDLTVQGRDIIMVLDSKISKLNIDTGNITDIKKFSESQIAYVSLCDNYFTTVEKSLNEENSGYKINMLRFDNTLISKTDISTTPKLMENSGLLNYFVYQDRLSVINKWGIEIKSESLDITPKDIIIFNGQKAIALVYTNKIRVIKI